MKKKGFIITECSTDVQVNESKEDKSLYITGIFSSFGMKNINQRVYEEKTLKRETDKILEKINNGQTVWGELSHPANPEINADKIAIKVESLEWHGQHLYGKAKILDTPMGNIARTLVKEGKIGISSRGLGTVSEDGTVNSDYKLITWDLVTDPSNHPSWVKGIYEGKSYDLDEDTSEIMSIDEAKEIYGKHIAEFIDKIKTKLS